MSGSTPTHQLSKDVIVETVLKTKRVLIVKTHFVDWRVVYLLARLVLGGAFIYSSIWKIKTPFEFADNIAAYQLLPANTINVLALGLPFCEIICGLLVLGGSHIRMGALGIVVMLLVFIGAILTALKRRFPIDCGCFGEHSWIESNLWVALGRDSVLLLLAMYIYWQSLPENKQNGAANA